MEVANGKQDYWLLRPGTSSQKGYTSKGLIWLVGREPWPMSVHILLLLLDISSIVYLALTCLSCLAL